MKATLLIAFCASFIFSHVLSAQPRLKEKDVVGVWMLKINIDEDDLMDAADEEDNAFARAILRGVSGFIGGVIDAIDVKFDLKSDNTVRVITKVFGKEDIEYSKWWINSSGELIIADTDSYKSDDSTVWRLEDGVLVGYATKKGNNMNEKVLLVRVH